MTVGLQPHNTKVIPKISAEYRGIRDETVTVILQTQRRPKTPNERAIRDLIRNTGLKRLKTPVDVTNPQARLWWAIIRQAVLDADGVTGNHLTHWDVQDAFAFFKDGRFQSMYADIGGNPQWGIEVIEQFFPYVAAGVWLSDKRSAIDEMV